MATQTVYESKVSSIQHEIGSNSDGLNEVSTLTLDGVVAKIIGQFMEVCNQDTNGAIARLLGSELLGQVRQVNGFR